MYCGKCGNLTSEEDVFCKKCGSKVSENELKLEKADNIIQSDKSKLSFWDKVKEEAKRQQNEKAEEIQRLKQLKKDKIPYCLKCHSTSLSANKKGFGFVKGVIGTTITGGMLDVGVLAGGLGANNLKMTCMNCGYQFKPGKK